MVQAMHVGPSSHQPLPFRAAFGRSRCPEHDGAARVPNAPLI